MSSDTMPFLQDVHNTIVVLAILTTEATLTVHGNGMQSIPGSRDTLTILGQYHDEHTPYTTPLSEYPGIHRYSDHPGPILGWIYPSLPPSQEKKAKDTAEIWSRPWSCLLEWSL